MSLLGNLTVGIVGSMGGLTDTFGQARAEVQKFGDSAQKLGKSFSKVGDNLTRKITLPVVGATTAAVGLVSALGFGRLVGMDNAQAKLRGLGYEGEAVEVIMNDVNSAVQGTTHTMAEGVDAAAGALAAGVKEGAELERYVKLVGDAAVGSNRPMNEMAQIFNRVQGSGKLMTQELNMIEMGMPGFAQAMANNLADGSLEAFREMVTNGEVGTKEFLDVMENFAGGMSDAYAETWSGMTKNVLSNIGIIGEALIGGLFEDGKKGLADFLTVLRSDGLKEWARETGESIREMAQVIIDRAIQIKEWWDSLSESTQQLAIKIGAIGAVVAVAIGPALSIIGTLISSFGILTKVIGLLMGPVGIAVVAIGALVAAGVLLYQNWDTVKEKAVEVFGAFSPLIETVKASFQTFMDSLAPIWESLKTLFESLLPILEKIGVVVGAVLVTALGILIGAFNGVVSAIGPVINAIINFVDFVVNMVNAIVALFTGDFAGAWQYLQDAGQSTIDFFVNIFNGLLNFIGGFIDGVIGFFHGLYMALVGNSIIPDMVNGILDWFKNMFQWVIDVVKNIVNGVINFFTNLKNGIVNIFNAVRSFISSVLSGIRSIFTSIITGIVSFVVGRFTSLKNTVSNIFNSLRGIVSSAFGRVTSAVKTGISNAYSAVTGKVRDFFNAGRNIVTSIADGIKGAIGKVTGAIGDVTQKIRDFLPFSPAKEGALRDIMDAKIPESIAQSIYNGSGDAVRAMQRLTNDLDAELFRPELNMSRKENQSHFTQYNSKLEGLMTELIDAVKDGKNIILEGRVVGKLIEKHVTERQELNKQIDAAFASPQRL